MSDSIYAAFVLSLQICILNLIIYLSAGNKLSFIGARLLAMQLKKMNCSTQRAENGRVAVDLLKGSLPGTFDFILMDLRMPVMDGIEATKLIRNELQMNSIPICALTGEMGDEISSECEKVGFTEFFQKPLPKKTLQELITKYKEDRNSGAVCL